MAEDKTCFIIMPITTPDRMLAEYRSDPDHFLHVLKCLFTPSIEQAGYRPIPPIAKGADLIHAEIVRNLETADIVLCDMSCLNPNVFFEFGIRTALNKPVCVVKDGLTTVVPFDTGILNHQEYKSSLNPWELETETTKMSEHVKASVERSNGDNMLWKYFGLKHQASSYEGETGIDARLAVLSAQIEAVQNRLLSPVPIHAPSRPAGIDLGDVLAHFLASRLPASCSSFSCIVDRGLVMVTYSGQIAPEVRQELASAIQATFGLGVGFKAGD